MKTLITFLLFIFTLSYSSLFGVNLAKNNVQFLNVKEEQWLQTLQRPLTIGITIIPNQILKTKHGYKGYSIDLFKTIEKMLHIKFHYKYYKNWNKLLQGAKNKEVDIIFLAQKTEDRLQYFNFTDIVLVQHNKIVTASKNISQINLKDLFGKKVALVTGSAIEEYVSINFPKIQIVPSQNEKDSLQKLIDKKADFTVVEPVRTSYYMKKDNLTHLHICGDFPYDYKLRIASRRDMAILNIILNKAIENITVADKKALALKWGYEKELFFDKKLLINIFIIFSIVLIFLFYLSLLNRKLKSTQKSLHKMNDTLQQKVQEEVEKNRQKDLAMLHQSRFAQMGQAINMIAHQWRQPLNTISLITQTMSLKCGKEDFSHEEIEKLKERTLLQIEQMSKTIDDFRDFFKEQKEKSDFLFDEMLGSLLNIVEPILEKSDIKLTVNSVENIKVNGFSNELFQAILNIIYNAKDALVEHKEQNRKIAINLTSTQDNAVLTIEDNAGGIAEDILQEIFKPYFSTKGSNGTGIGLNMAKIIVEQHMDGVLKAYNTKEGALFEIQLPLKKN